jgi:hypothetical protein
MWTHPPESDSTLEPSNTIFKNETFEVLRVKTPWVYVRSVHQNRALVEGWVRESDLQDDPKEFGYFFSASGANLKIKPKKDSKTVLKLKLGTKLLALSTQDDWVFTKWGSYQGWIHSKSIFSKLNFRKSNIQALGGAHLNWSLVKATGKIQSWVQKKEVLWNEARSAQAGTIWYSLENTRDPQIEKSKVSSESLFKAGIFDLASHPLNHKFKLISSHGIYKTTNGNSWERIEKFGQEDHPLLITEAGTIFVGPYVSYDKGVTFQNYLRFDKILQAFYKAKQKLPLQITLTGLNYDSQNATLSLEINGVYKIMSADSGASWNLFDSNDRLVPTDLSRRFSIQLDSSRSEYKVEESSHKRLATIVSY